MRKNLLPLLTLIALLLCAVCLRASAQDEPAGGGKVAYHLIVVHKDGSQVKVPFEHQPEFRHDGTALQLTSQELDMTYPAGTLDHFRIEAEQGPSTAIRDIETAGKRETPRHSFVAGGIELSGAVPGSDVTLYDLDGRTAGRTTVDADGSAMISLGELAPGIYIIKTANLTFKVIKK